MFASMIPSVSLGSICGFLWIICIILYPAACPEAKAVTHGVASPKDLIRINVKNNYARTNIHFRDKMNSNITSTINQNSVIAMETVTVITSGTK
jgi:hypothetical protein